MRKVAAALTVGLSGETEAEAGIRLSRVANVSEIAPPVVTKHRSLLNSAMQALADYIPSLSPSSCSSRLERPCRCSDYAEAAAAACCTAENGRSVRAARSTGCCSFLAARSASFHSPFPSRRLLLVYDQ
jgi:hypothetical protein